MEAKEFERNGEKFEEVSLEDGQEQANVQIKVPPQFKHIDPDILKAVYAGQAETKKIKDYIVTSLNGLVKDRNDLDTLMKDVSLIPLLLCDYDPEIVDERKNPEKRDTVSPSKKNATWQFGTFSRGTAKKLKEEVVNMSDLAIETPAPSSKKRLLVPRAVQELSDKELASLFRNVMSSNLNEVQEGKFQALNIDTIIDTLPVNSSDKAKYDRDMMLEGLEAVILAKGGRITEEDTRTLMRDKIAGNYAAFTGQFDKINMILVNLEELAPYFTFIDEEDIALDILLKQRDLVKNIIIKPAKIKIEPEIQKLEQVVTLQPLERFLKEMQETEAKLTKDIKEIKTLEQLKECRLNISKMLGCVKEIALRIEDWSNSREQKDVYQSLTKMVMTKVDELLPQFDLFRSPWKDLTEDQLANSKKREEFKENFKKWLAESEVLKETLRPLTEKIFTLHQRTSLLNAAQTGDSVLVEQIRKLPGEKLLFSEELALIEKAVKSGKNPNDPAHNPLNLIKDKDGNTALHLAVMGGHDNTVMALLNAGASVNIQNNEGKTALHLAVEYFGKAPGELVTTKPASKPQTAAEFQTAYGKLCIIRQLCMKGNADPDLVDHKGKRAEDFAKAMIKSDLHKEEQLPQEYWQRAVQDIDAYRAVREKTTFEVKKFQLQKSASLSLVPVVEPKTPEDKKNRPTKASSEEKKTTFFDSLRRKKKDGRNSTRNLNEVFEEISLDDNNSKPTPTASSKKADPETAKGQWTSKHSPASQSMPVMPGTKSRNLLASSRVSMQELSKYKEEQRKMRMNLEKDGFMTVSDMQQCAYMNYVAKRSNSTEGFGLYKDPNGSITITSAKEGKVTYSFNAVKDLVAFGEVLPSTEKADRETSKMFSS